MKRKGIVFYWASNQSPKTVFEHVSEIANVQGYDFDVVNIQESFFYKIIISPIGFLVLNKYDIIIIHNTISYNADYSRSFLKKLKFRKSAKLVYMKQDEMLHVNKTKDIIKDFNVHLLVTLIKKEEIEKVYPRNEFPNLNFFHSLTGYLSKDLIAGYPSIDIDKRTIDVFYRGMMTPFEWGKASFEKYMIGQKFLESVSSLKVQLNCDISSRTEDRVYGLEWIKKLSNSRAVLGVESGASIFDFDGTIATRMQMLINANPELTFEVASSTLLSEYEGNVYYRMLSPRHLEACMAGAVPVMFEGNYDGFFMPDVNYIKLEADFSNFVEVCRSLEDLTYLNQIVERNNVDILENRFLTYDYFKESLKESIDSLFD